MRRLLQAASGASGGSLAAPVHVYYVAHWDDDGLWMDLDMANQHISGNTIHNVVLTGMEHDAVYPLLTGTGGVCPIHSVTHSFTMTYPQFTSYRDAEGLANAADLGGHQHIPSDRQEGGLCHIPALCFGGTTCPHRRCVNPRHLKPVTNKENCAPDRGVHRYPPDGGVAAKWQRAKEHCPSGHPYSAANTYILPSRPGARYCRACHLIQTRLRRGWPRDRALAGFAPFGDDQRV